MENLLRFIILLPTIMAIFLGCGAVKDADQVGIEFYNQLKNKNFDKAIDLVDKEALEHTPKQVWIDGLIEKDNQMGELLTSTRTDFQSQTVDNVTRVTIKYKVRYIEGSCAEQLEFIKRGDLYTITFYKFNQLDKNE